MPDLEKLRLRAEDAEPSTGQPEPDRSAPSIVCTRFVGAKGLSAGHVFVLGMVNGELPRDPTSITDREISEFIVALSRTRQQCHVISNGRFASIGGLRVSAFIDWVRGQLEPRTIDAAYWHGATSASAAPVRRSPRPRDET